MMEGTDDAARDRAPWQVWAAALGVAALRSIPFLRAVQLGTGGVGRQTWLPIGYIPKDWLAYVAFIREQAQSGDLLLSNPFTTAPQDGRFILLFHQTLGMVCKATGLDPFWALELSRWPLTIAFFLVLWWFLGPVLKERNERLWAVALVAFSGGLDFILRLAADALPASIAATVRQDLWILYGWNTFEAMFNPLWIAGMTLMLVVMRPLLQPGGPAGPADHARVGLGLVLLWFTHSYSAIVAVAAIAVLVPVEWWSSGRFPLQRTLRSAWAVLPALAVAAAVSLWQARDQVFRDCTGGVLGSQAAAVFWYPATLALPGLLAVAGWIEWRQTARPWRLSVGAWLLAVVLLHTSPVLNGYHFVYALHLPVCILAACVAVPALDRARDLLGRLAGTMALGVLLFSSPVFVTAESVVDVERESAVPAYAMEIVDALRDKPHGNTFAPPAIGNLVPALTGNRVFAGQWFLTPDLGAKEDLYWKIVKNPAGNSASLHELVGHQKIRYFVVPEAGAEELMDAVPTSLMVVSRAGGLVLLATIGE